MCWVNYYNYYEETLYFHSNITFQNILSPLNEESCDSIDRFDEGVEFSIRMNSEGLWIPITLAIRSDKIGNHASILIGSRENDENVEDVVIREYHVEPDLSSPGSIYEYSVQVCDFTRTINSIQFRWLQTSSKHKLKDIWTLEAVNISYHDISSNILLLLDQFDESELK